MYFKQRSQAHPKTFDELAGPPTSSCGMRFVA
jgi:hypothetical protein